MTPQFSLTVSVNNTTLTDRYFTGEPGLSFVIETRGKKILFDFGYSDAFLANAGDPVQPANGPSRYPRRRMMR